MDDKIFSVCPGNFAEKWDGKCPLTSKSWRSTWVNFNTLFSYPVEIRKASYTTNAIESLNSVIHKASKRRNLFPADSSVKQVIYLAVQVV
jgi:putative transposase